MWGFRIPHPQHSPLNLSANIIWSSLQAGLFEAHKIQKYLLGNFPDHRNRERGMNTSIAKKPSANCCWPLTNMALQKIQMHGVIIIHEQWSHIVPSGIFWTSLFLNSLKQKYIDPRKQQTTKKSQQQREKWMSNYVITTLKLRSLRTDFLCFLLPELAELPANNGTLLDACHHDLEAVEIVQWGSPGANGKLATPSTTLPLAVNLPLLHGLGKILLLRVPGDGNSDIGERQTLEVDGSSHHIRSID